MNRLQAYYEVTIRLIKLAESLPSIDDRETGIVQLESLLDERQILLKDFAEPYTNEEMDLGRKLVSMEKELNGRLSIVKQKIGLDIKEVKQKKANTQKYKDPYQSLATDGMFYDKRN